LAEVDVGLFKHPCLVRGTVHTPYGAFTIVRGLADLPDDIGEALGWPRVTEEHVVPTASATTPTIGGVGTDHLNPNAIR
jgi:hypothetical protein